ncbi:permease-like cell division protein FtsX [Latilactobacillus fuchuensis]|uniref:permease-like cell division protein FtsX n=1 Tax=Latilactobacillus fuchuensis TaxID=164393 RepID=UPI0020C7A87F|nr:permease-like cell division protein FtsX [Latilactobacillus fuchuensis]MCP8857093.1 permease-like cell division protein FtsX [Latilactobacillus fuchuensis]
MKTRTIKRHLDDSFKSLRRNGWMSVAAVSAVTVTLLLVGIFFAMIFNFNKISKDIENDVHVRVMIERGTTTQQKDQLQKKLEKMASVKDVTYSSRKKELNKVVGSYGQSFKMFTGDDNPLYDVYTVSTTKPTQTIKVAKKAKQLKHVYDATYGGNNAKKLFSVMSGVRRWGIGFTILLLFVAVFLISNTIRITILSRRDEIGIMRLVGATNSYIRWPFLLEGAWTGLLGVVIPILVVDIGYGWVYRHMAISMASAGYSLLKPGMFLFELDLTMAVIGIVIGALGSVISMRRFLKI